MDQQQGSTPPPTPTPGPSNHTDDKKSTGKIVAIAAAVGGVGLLAILGALAWVYKTRYRRASDGPRVQSDMEKIEDHLDEVRVGGTHGDGDGTGSTAGAARKAAPIGVPGRKTSGALSHAHGDAQSGTMSTTSSSVAIAALGTTSRHAMKPSGSQHLRAARSASTELSVHSTAGGGGSRAGATYQAKDSRSCYTRDEYTYYSGEDDEQELGLPAVAVHNTYVGKGEGCMCACAPASTAVAW